MLRVFVIVAAVGFSMFKVWQLLIGISLSFHVGILVNFRTGFNILTVDILV